MTLVADNAYAGGYYFNMGKNRGEVENSDPLRFNPSSVTEDNRTNTITNSSDAAKPVSIRAKAVRPDDVTAIGKEEDERNYYYGGSSQGNDDGYDGVKDDDGKLVWECPHCHNRDQDKMNVARRTCGYIGTQFWNQGRTQEIKERVLHL